MENDTGKQSVPQLKDIGGREMLDISLLKRVVLSPPEIEAEVNTFLALPIELDEQNVSSVITSAEIAASIATDRLHLSVIEITQNNKDQEIQKQRTSMGIYKGYIVTHLRNILLLGKTMQLRGQTALLNAVPKKYRPLVERIWELGPISEKFNPEAIDSPYRRKMRSIFANDNANIEGEHVPFFQIAQRFTNPNESIRNTALTEMHRIIRSHQEDLTNNMNQLLQDHETDTRALHPGVPPEQLPSPEEAFLKFNGISAPFLEALITKLPEYNKEIPQRFYQFKNELLGRKLQFNERNISLVEKPRDIPLNEALSIIKNALHKMSAGEQSEPESELDKEFALFVENYLDTQSMPGGMTTYPYSREDILPYSFSQYNMRISGVLQISHEFGHWLSDKRSQDSKTKSALATQPPFIAEIASTLIEHAVVQYMIDTAKIEEERAEILVSAMTSKMSVFFRPLAGFQFEQDIHNEYRKLYNQDKNAKLPMEFINQRFITRMREYIGNDIDPSEGEELGWTYWDQKYVPFYDIGYPLSYLISRLLYKGIEKDREKGMEIINNFLSHGAIESPQAILDSIGINISNKEFINQLIDNALEEDKQLLKATEAICGKAYSSKNP
ncbi:MAG TPA: M3 family metallopeptidase [Candidatus Saccharimonadales bacterium]|nr:M3 family metallopeptidase [Candidatus Saccharimonadales bacterium]